MVVMLQQKCLAMLFFLGEALKFFNNPFKHVLLFHTKDQIIFIYLFAKQLAFCCFFLCNFYYNDESIVSVHHTLDQIFTSQNFYLGSECSECACGWKSNQIY